MTMDIETVSFKDKQLPILITHYDPFNGSVSFKLNKNYLINREYHKAVKI